MIEDIHNNPKLKNLGHIFIDVNRKNTWLNENNLNYLHSMSGEIEKGLKSHKVNKLSGGFYVGNNPSVLNPIHSQTSLFN